MFSAEFTMSQKKAMEEAFKMGSTESMANYIGAPYGLPEKISTCDALHDVFMAITKHVVIENGGVKVNWTSVPFENIKDYNSTLVSLLIPFCLPTLNISQIEKSYKALMEVRHLFALLSINSPNNGQAKLCLMNFEDKIMAIGSKLVQQQLVSSEDLALLNSCACCVWPQEISELLELIAKSNQEQTSLIYSRVAKAGNYQEAVSVILNDQNTLNFVCKEYFCFLNKRISPCDFSNYLTKFNSGRELLDNMLEKPELIEFFSFLYRKVKGEEPNLQKVSAWLKNLGQ
jgi:hypothetical protein